MLCVTHARQHLVTVVAAVIQLILINPCCLRQESPWSLTQGGCDGLEGHHTQVEWVTRATSVFSLHTASPRCWQGCSSESFGPVDRKSLPWRYLGKQCIQEWMAHVSEAMSLMTSGLQADTIQWPQSTFAPSWKHRKHF
jgi:hypothetical protein